MSFLSRRAATISISTISSAAAAGFTFYSYRYKQQKMLPSYEATFSVPLECESCVTDIKSALSTVDGSFPTPLSPPSLLLPKSLNQHIINQA